MKTRSNYERRDEVEDSCHCETEEVKEVKEAPLDVAAPPVTDAHGCGGASSSGVWCRGRMVQNS